MRKTNRKIVINTGIYEDRVAILQNGRLEEFYIEQQDTEKLFGNIYKAIVDSVVPGIGAVFVNIGTGKNGFLYMHDVQDKASILDEDADDFIIEHPGRDKQRDLGKYLKKGQEILVQVEKESIGDKGPRLTTQISIPGRYLVLTPLDDSLGISKRISDPEERNRIRNIIKQQRLPKGIGCIVRTAAKGIPPKNISREVRYLIKLWSNIHGRTRKANPPVALYEECSLMLRILRDQFTEDVDEVIIDQKEAYKNAVRFMSLFMPSLKPRIKFYNVKTPIFEKYGLARDIENIFKRKIPLRNGGSIVIDETEGMVAIDVNTARYTGKSDVDETIFKTNMEAAREIARQIRLRDIGGIIIIDFIDMRSKDHRRRIENMLEDSFRRDKAKSKIIGMSPIGVVEMTRQRVRKSLESSMYSKCPNCRGRGLIKSDITVSMQVLREIERVSHITRARRIDVWIHPTIFAYLMEREKDLVIPLQKRCRKSVTFYRDESLNREDMRVK